MTQRDGGKGGAQRDGEKGGRDRGEEDRVEGGNEREGQVHCRPVSRTASLAAGHAFASTNIPSLDLY